MPAAAGARLSHSDCAVTTEALSCGSCYILNDKWGCSMWRVLCCRLTAYAHSPTNLIKPQQSMGIIFTNPGLLLGSAALGIDLSFLSMVGLWFMVGLMFLLWTLVRPMVYGFFLWFQWC